MRIVFQTHVGRNGLNTALVRHLAVEKESKQENGNASTRTRFLFLSIAKEILLKPGHATPT